MTPARTPARRQSAVPEPRPSMPRKPADDELRRMVLLLETAEVLELRAQRSDDPRQAVVLRRRAGQRRQEAARMRAGLAARGVALRRPAPQV